MNATQLANYLVKEPARRMIRVYGRSVIMTYLSLYCALSMKGNRDIRLPFHSLKSPTGDILTIKIDPRKIERRCPVRLNETSFFIKSGSWDLVTEQLDSIGTYSFMRELHQELSQGLHYRETQIYSIFTTKLQMGEPLRGQGRTLDSMSKIDHYFQSRVQLMMSMQRVGYMAQSMLGNNGNELAVAIGRDGDIIKYGDGNHRCAMARILGLKEIVVAVRRVHRLWVLRCQEEYRASPLNAIVKGLQDLESAAQVEDA